MTTTQRCRWGSNPRLFGLESSTLPLSHSAPYNEVHVCVTSKDSNQPAQTRSLIKAFARHLNILRLLNYPGVYKIKRRMHRLVWVYTCQNATGHIDGITCRGSYYYTKMQMSLGNNKINGQERVFFPSCLTLVHVFVYHKATLHMSHDYHCDIGYHERR